MTHLWRLTPQEAQREGRAYATPVVLPKKVVVRPPEELNPLTTWMD